MKKIQLATAVLIALAGAIPAAAQDPATQEKPKPAPEQEPPPTPPVVQEEGPKRDFFDFEKLELMPRLTLVSYSSDFDADPEFGAGILLRAPLPWLSQDVLGLKEADLGAFLSATVSRLDRDDDDVPDADADGTVFFLALGLDYGLYRDESFFVAAQLGVEYAHFGSIDETDSGTGLLLGLSAGLQFVEGLWVTLNPQVSIGEDPVFFVHLGVTIAF